MVTFSHKWTCSFCSFRRWNDGSTSRDCQKCGEIADVSSRLLFYWNMQCAMLMFVPANLPKYRVGMNFDEAHKGHIYEAPRMTSQERTYLNDSTVRTAKILHLHHT